MTTERVTTVYKQEINDLGQVVNILDHVRPATDDDILGYESFANDIVSSLASAQDPWFARYERSEYHRLHDKFDLERRTEMSEHCKFGIAKCDSMEDVRRCLESAIDFASSLNDTLCTEKHPDWWHAGEAVDSLLEAYFYMFGPRPGATK